MPLPLFQQKHSLLFKNGSADVHHSVEHAPAEYQPMSGTTQTLLTQSSRIIDPVVVNTIVSQTSGGMAAMKRFVDAIQNQIEQQTTLIFLLRWQTTSHHTLRRWAVQTGEGGPDSWQTFGGSGTLGVIVVPAERQGRCLTRSNLAESERRCGKIFSSGPSGLSKNCMNRSGPCCFLAKRQESERKRPAQLNAPFPAKPMRLNNTGCKACSRLGRQVGKEKPQRDLSEPSGYSFSLSARLTHLCAVCEEAVAFVTLL